MLYDSLFIAVYLATVYIMTLHLNRPHFPGSKGKLTLL